MLSFACNRLSGYSYKANFKFIKLDKLQTILHIFKGAPAIVKAAHSIGIKSFGGGFFRGVSDNSKVLRHSAIVFLSTEQINQQILTNLLGTLQLL